MRLKILKPDYKRPDCVVITGIVCSSASEGAGYLSSAAANSRHATVNSYPAITCEESAFWKGNTHRI